MPVKYECDSVDQTDDFAKHIKLEMSHKKKISNGCVAWPILRYSDVIMSKMASQITGVSIVYSTVYSGADQRKHQSSVSLALCEGNSPITSEFPAETASNTENISIWWRYHVNFLDDEITFRLAILRNDV